MKKRILFSIMVIAIAAALVAGATTAYFSDVERSFGNTFTAGKLDLKIQGGDENFIRFDVKNMKPGDQPKGSYRLTNDGTISGYLNITKIVVTDFENDLVEPELEAGDTTADVGELSSMLNIRLFFDNDGNGWISDGDEMIYNGKMSAMPSALLVDKLMPAGTSVDIIGEAIIDWWSSAQDNLAQTDSCILDIEFTLHQVKQGASH